MNIGVAVADIVTVNSKLILEGATLNLASGLFTSGNLSFEMCSGTLNVSTVGNSTLNSSFGVTGTTALLNMSGGTINLIQAPSNPTVLAYQFSGLTNISGGSLVVGSTTTSGKYDFLIQGNTPTISIDNTTHKKNIILNGLTNVYGNLTLGAGDTLDMRSSSIQVYGNTSSIGFEWRCY